MKTSKNKDCQAFASKIWIFTQTYKSKQVLGKKGPKKKY